MFIEFRFINPFWWVIKLPILSSNERASIFSIYLIGLMIKVVRVAMILDDKKLLKIK